MCLLVNGWKKNGYFVEFGACDGMFVSNSYLLEKNYGWRGILSEPARTWHQDLNSNRNCILDYRAVWKQSELNLPFYEMEAPGLSRIASENSKSFSSRQRRQYFVPTVTLQELLDFHLAPKKIDFLSIDTEGSEFEILAKFDFTIYSFNFVSIEHNYESSRDLVNELLLNNGYIRILSEISKYEDWFVPKQNLPEIENTIKLKVSSRSS
jgi:FkbM family methyltransferase